MTENEKIKKVINGLNFLKEKLYNGIYADRLDCIDYAISAIKELQMYKDNKLCLVPEDVYSRQYCELDAYKEIGTVEECREAVEKQKLKKPILRNDNGKLRKSCPICGCFFSPLSRNCPKCGQAIDEDLEGMEDGT